MLNSLVKNFFGSQADRQFKRTLPQVSQISQLAASYQSLSDAQLQAKTATFRQDLQERNADSRQQLEAIEERLRGDLDPEQREQLNDQYGELDRTIRDVEAAFLDEIMPEAFAMIVEICRRLLGRTWDRAGESVEWDMVPYDVQISAVSRCTKARSPKWLPAKARP